MDNVSSLGLSISDLRIVKKLGAFVNFVLEKNHNMIMMKPRAMPYEIFRKKRDLISSELIFRIKCHNELVT